MARPRPRPYGRAAIVGHAVGVFAERGRVERGGPVGARSRRQRARHSRRVRPPVPARGRRHGQRVRLGPKDGHGELDRRRRSQRDRPADAALRRGLARHRTEHDGRTGGRLLDARPEPRRAARPGPGRSPGRGARDGRRLSGATGLAGRRTIVRMTFGTCSQGNVVTTSGSGRPARSVSFSSRGGAGLGGTLAGVSGKVDRRDERGPAGASGVVAGRPGRCPRGHLPRRRAADPPAERAGAARDRDELRRPRRHRQAARPRIAGPPDRHRRRPRGSVRPARPRSPARRGAGVPRDARG